MPINIETKKKRREWDHYPHAPNTGTYISLRPHFSLIEAPPETDEEENKLVLPILDIDSIEIQMPKLGSPNANYRITDVTANSFVENAAMLSYIREKLNGNTDPETHLEEDDHIWITTNSPDIISLWCLHHKGEFAGQANVTFGSMPLKMRVSAAELAQDQFQQGSHRLRSLQFDNEAVAWSYLNDWNYVVRRNGTLHGISNDDPHFPWANNIQAAQYNDHLVSAEDDDS